MLITDLYSVGADGAVTLRIPIEQYMHNTIITCNKSMMQQIQNVDRVALSNVTILINGETGTGKELYADYIHAMSPRSGKPYIKINCATISETLFESEMFGYMPGTFTGGLKNGKKGIFEVANNGTLFLDEISEMPNSIQPRFLRVLQEHRFSKVGGYEEIPTDVRLIVATNRNLQELVDTGHFRQDLFYRLNVIDMQLLPLRERPEDIILLSLHYLDSFNHKYGLNKQMSEQAMDSLLKYDWPGNVRELSHLMEKIVLLSENTLVTDALLTHRVKVSEEDFLVSNLPLMPDTCLDDTHLPNRGLKAIVSEYEHHVILAYLKKYSNLRAAAAALDISAASLSRKLSRNLLENQTDDTE